MDQDNQGQPQNADYSFLNDTKQQANANSLAGKLAAADKKTKTLIVAAGLGLLFVIIGLFAAVTLGSNDDTKQNFIGLAQRQHELIRIAEIGTEKARSQDTLNVATTTRAALNSSQQKVAQKVASKGTQLRRADVRIRENPNTTEELTSAEQANRFDEVFLKTLKTELLEYQSAIELTATHIGGTDLELLRELNDEVNLLVEAIDRIND